MTQTKDQDLIEHALLGGFVTVAAGAIFPTTVMPAVSTISSRIVSSVTIAATGGS